MARQRPAAPPTAIVPVPFLLAAVALGLAGCGSGGSGSAQTAGASVVAYLHGFLDGDGAAVCDHLTPQDATYETAAANRELGGSGVPAGLTGSHALSCAAASHKLSSATVRIKGTDRATQLVLRNGRWLIDTASFQR